jgi:small subunit ribosomal protein S11
MAEEKKEEVEEKGKERVEKKETKEKAEEVKKENVEKKKTEEKTLEKKEEIKEKKFKVKEERTGIAYVFSSPNNTIVHITDLAGNTLSRISGGMITKHSRLKANPTNAMFVAKRAAERPRDLGITNLYIRMRAKTGASGHGPGAHAAVKTLGKEGFRVLSVLDSTKFPRGGPKKKGGKRGRRV